MVMLEAAGGSCSGAVSHLLGQRIAGHSIPNYGGRLGRHTRVADIAGCTERANPHGLSCRVAEGKVIPTGQVSSARSES